MTQWVYGFGGGSADGESSMKNLLGGKGANLAEMSSLGLPVPPGFTITTEACVHYFSNGQSYPDALADQVKAGLEKVEAITGKTFGDVKNPLLVSVRSGARASMPGMMDTVLNLGLNDQTVEGLAALSGDRRFALDSYRRFITMYSNVVLGLSHDDFEEVLDDHKDRLGVTIDTDLDADHWQAVIADYLAVVEDRLGQPFPQDPHAQLWGAIGAVFDSWMNDRAKFYRRMHDIPESWGTAVNIQSMVFGNMGQTSATGVAFTRNPSTGEAKLYGEFLINAQGEDVVAGIRTPQSLTRAGREEMGETAPSMEEAMPEVFGQFVEVVGRLETHYRDMQDIEFTVEQGRLWMLQTRNGKRTAKSALKIAVDLASEGVISEEEAVSRVDPSALDQLLHPTLDPKAERHVVAAGLPASPGAATGKIVFDADEAERMNQLGDAVILVREETSPEDIHGMHAARGIVTARGGMTSHAAVVARGMGRPCVSGAGEIHIDEKAGTFTARGRTFKAGEIITIDGSKGEVLDGAVPMIEPELTGDFQTLMAWADKVRRLRVRANAETPLDAKTARGFGAEGIGLCRTEHMFFDDARIAAVREMILADDEAGRRAALAKIAPFQKSDFVELFQIMAGLPVTIRLLDPPLHEFIPHSEAEIDALATTQGLDAAKLKRRAKELHETNPMLGHRGCRLGVAYPEIYEMQVRAILEAALEVQATSGEAPLPEIMHPLVALGLEMKYLRELTDRTAKAVFEETGQSIAYLVGTMIELPRAALRAGDLAEHAQFFSFGTNDLTQTTFGISRDDSGRFLQAYMDKGIFETDPFVRLDQEGVGDLIRIAAERGRAVRADVKLGICGEHGGDPSSIAFCEGAGLDYVSCSPYRVPIARLAAAQAALDARSGTEREKDR
ncbi:MULTISPECIES: pyruvate, phosphate dikinase [unclassified Brevundimonas]|jgi:pyruvate,orthophosphate dikinase|uniref:pyruvate, phosphate dikinase n=2 Tax=Brevundimonas TaxID=41275 RepID=UPI000C551361|nr:MULTISPECIES: pyruvate, phosphate dikinase [unclassified Brevundimonas]MAL88532.1 pyruvate, phosphate dikinase [Brevundimonas sp.]|tara:strand:- start:357 stop:3047 length:2691 start_codon:yes stop_codon:yes gene_type:complete